MKRGEDFESVSYKGQFKQAVGRRGVSEQWVNSIECQDGYSNWEEAEIDTSHDIDMRNY